MSSLFFLRVIEFFKKVQEVNPGDDADHFPIFHYGKGRKVMIHHQPDCHGGMHGRRDGVHFRGHYLCGSTPLGLARCAPLWAKEGNPEIFLPDRFAGFKPFVRSPVDQVLRSHDAEQTARLFCRIANAWPSPLPG